MRAWALLTLLVASAASAQEVLINFDDRVAPNCAFGGAERVGDQWIAEGVRFLPPFTIDSSATDEVVAAMAVAVEAAG